MWVFAAVPAGLAVALQDAPVWAVLMALAGCVLWYHLSYQHLARQQQVPPLPDSGPVPLDEPEAVPAGTRPSSQF